MGLALRKEELEIEESKSVTRLEGAIRKIKSDRGYLFIAGDDGIDYFAHWTSFDKTSKNFREVEIQDRVSFVCIVGNKGPRAILIKVL